MYLSSLLVMMLPVFAMAEGTRKVFYEDETEPFPEGTELLTLRVCPLLGADCMLLTLGEHSMLVDTGRKMQAGTVLDVLNEAGIFCAGMDVDGAGLPFLKAMNPNAGSKSVPEMREIIEYADMPFIVKGIMTVKGAEKAVEAGAAAIVVSNHGGRVQGGVAATAEVLPEIAEAVKGDTVILVDGGIRSGVDVFRAIALGADGVLIGRPILPMIYAAGEEGFKVYMDKIIGELKSTMTMCGAATLADITRDKVRL